MDNALAKSALSFAAFATAAKSAFSLAREAADLADARQNLQITAAEMGVSFERLEQVTRGATEGMVDNLTLLKANHKALKLGISTDIADLGKLWEVSEALSGDFGQSVSETFEQLSNAIATGNGKALLSLGLLPESFKKASDAGSLLERRAELLREVLTQAGDRVAAVSAHGDTAADKFDRFSVATQNLWTSLGEGLLPIVTSVVEGLTKIADAAGVVIQKFAQLADMSGSKNPFLGKTIEELQAMRAAAADKVGAAQSKLSSLTDPSQSYRRAGESDITTQIMAAEVQYQGELAILKQIDDALENLQKRVDARLKAEKEIADNIARAAEEEKKKKKAEEEAREAERKAKKELEDAQNRFNKAVEETEKASAKAAETFLDGFGVKTVTNLKEAEDLLINMTAAAGGFAVGLKDGTTEAGKMLDQLSKLDGKATEYNENFQSMLRNRGYNSASDLRGLTPDYAMMGMMNFMSGGLFTTQGDTKSALNDIQEPLSKTIANAVTAGFANADFSSLELTLGSILSSVLSKSVATSNPVVDAATGAVNWGNLGVNLAVNAATKVLTRPGRFFGGREEHGKEAIQQAADLKGRMGQAYVDSFVSEMTSVFAGKAMRDAIANARFGYYGTSIGYTWNDSGNGWTSDRTRTYALADNGASAALKKLTDAVKDAEIFSENREAWINLQAAKGYEYSALKDKVAAYESASSYYGEASLKWTDGSVNQGENLTKLTYEIQSTLAEMVRELGAATAARFTAAASGFSKYAPWLDNIYMRNQRSEQSFSGNGIFSPVVRGIPMPGFDGYSASVDGLSRDQYYDAFEKLQNDFADRNISTGLLDIVKESGSGRYELEKLRVTGSEDYAEAYADYLDKQISAIEEVMERQEEIFKDATRTFEERSAALANYEAAQDSYYQAKLDSLAAEQAAEEAIKQKQQEADLRKAERMEAALSLVGEVAQRGDRIVILQGGDSTTALKELLEKFSDDPEVSAILQAAITNNEAKARWGN
ncbi:hypothetical protein MASR1M12_41830 [Erysipelotrichia bacterium]